MLLSHKFAHNMQHELQTMALTSTSTSQFPQADDQHQLIEDLKEELRVARQQLQAEKSENQRCRRQIADFLQDQRQVRSQIEELETRHRDQDSLVFSLESRNATLEELSENLRRECDKLRLSVEEAKEKAKEAVAAATSSALSLSNANNKPVKERERVLFVTKENSRELKVRGFQFQSRFSLSKLLFTVSRTSLITHHTS